ncbi:MAG: hypothetical protein VW378_07670 [bacterium]
MRSGGVSSGGSSGKGPDFSADPTRLSKANPYLSLGVSNGLGELSLDPVEGSDACSMDAEMPEFAACTREIHTRVQELVDLEDQIPIGHSAGVLHDIMQDDTLSDFLFPLGEGLSVKAGYQAVIADLGSPDPMTQLKAVEDVSNLCAFSFKRCEEALQDSSSFSGQVNCRRYALMKIAGVLFQLSLTSLQSLASSDDHSQYQRMCAAQLAVQSLMFNHVVPFAEQLKTESSIGYIIEGATNIESIREEGEAVYAYFSKIDTGSARPSAPSHAFNILPEHFCQFLCIETTIVEDPIPRLGLEEEDKIFPDKLMLLQDVDVDEGGIDIRPNLFPQDPSRHVPFVSLHDSDGNHDSLRLALRSSQVSAQDLFELLDREPLAFSKPVRVEAEVIPSASSAEARGQDRLHYSLELSEATASRGTEGEAVIDEEDVRGVVVADDVSRFEHVANSYDADVSMDLAASVVSPRSGEASVARVTGLEGGVDPTAVPDLPSSYATKLVADIKEGVAFAKRDRSKYVIELDMDGCFLNGLVEHRNFDKHNIVNQDVLEMLQQIKKYAQDQEVDICLNICSTASLDTLSSEQRRAIFSALSEISPNQDSFFQCSALGCVQEFDTQGEPFHLYRIFQPKFVKGERYLNKPEAIQFMRALEKASTGNTQQKRQILARGGRDLRVEHDACEGVCFVDNSPDYFNEMLDQDMQVQKVLPYSAIVDTNNNKVDYDPTDQTFRDNINVIDQQWLSSVDRHGRAFTMHASVNQLESYHVYPAAKQCFAYKPSDDPTLFGFVTAKGLGEAFAKDA